MTAWVQYNDLTVKSDGRFWGAKGGFFMYHWINDKAFLGRMKGLCGDLVNQLVQAINREGRLEVRQHLVGSGAKNLITQNANRPIDLDYNLEILRSEGFSIKDGCGIKEYVREIFDEVLERNGWEPCNDSTSALTTKLHRFPDGNQTLFSIDLCITREDECGRRLRLIHNKTGKVQSDRKGPVGQLGLERSTARKRIGRSCRLAEGKRVLAGAPRGLSRKEKSIPFKK